MRKEPAGVLQTQRPALAPEKTIRVLDQPDQNHPIRRTDRYNLAVAPVATILRAG